jgi:ERCC4-type nuclease
MTIVCDTVEKKNEHIISYFEKHKINYQHRKLREGDYCFMIPKNEELGFPTDYYFTDELAIERKSNLSEIATNIQNETFHYELKRAQNKAHKFLLIEQIGGWHDIITQKYQNNYNPKSFYGALHTFEIKYGLHICFLPKEEMGLMIWSICKSVLNQYTLHESV